jgi:hypothetical protein
MAEEAQVRRQERQDRDELRSTYQQSFWYLSGAVTLEAQNGTWHFRDLSAARTLEDVQRIGTLYAGGC